MTSKKDLTAEQYNICFQKGTEAPFSGKYDKHYEPGAYHCVSCGELLFLSTSKYNSGSGWPSFWEPAATLKYEKDLSLGRERVEVLCQCGAHLGHVFDDGPKPTGKRYCINSLALDFKS